MSLTFERKLPIVLFLVFLTLSTIGFFIYQNTVSVQEAIKWEKQTQEVLSILDETTSLSLDVHQAMTSFVILGIDRYLEPLNRATPKISQNIARLRQLVNSNPELTSSNPTIVEELDRLEQQLNEYLEKAKAKVDNRKSGGSDAAIGELPWGEGEKLLEQIRASADGIKTAEILTLQSREQTLGQQLSWTIWILIGSSVAGIISLGLANLIVLSEIKKRRIAQNDLVEANEGLERNIEQRTMELKSANEKLTEIGSEREIILLNEQSARKEAEIANRLRDEFMATVSHELRTPLNSILGWARLMNGGNLDETQSRKALATIIKNSETQNRLIEDLLDVARVISGKLQLELVEIDPAELVAISVETMRPIAEAKHMNIQLSVDENAAGHSVKGDRDRLMQVFTNLLTNAIKFSPDGSSIHVSMRHDDSAVMTSIEDEGKGISPEFLPLVFERFRQDTAGTSKNGGLGLGLAIVRNLVEIHGGSVKAESEGENKGSKFTVLLPTSERSGSVVDQQLDGA
jgi:signal transduction histidine kinase